MKIKTRKYCLICNNDEMNKIIDLGLHPFADTFIPPDRLNDSEPIYPLISSLCNSCGHIQLNCVTDPHSRYVDYEYSFTSSNSSFSIQHWKSFYNRISSKLELSKNSFILEIGSNDGTLGKEFINRGYKFLGIDASPLMVEIANKNKINTILGLFNADMVDEVISDFGNPELIIANNVLNHADIPNEFVKNISKLLSKDGVFVFEVPYWQIEFDTKSFGKIYHEHINYFTIRSLKKLLGNFNLEMTSIEIIEYHGGSLRVYANRKKHRTRVYENNIELMIRNEVKSGVFNPKSYIPFMELIQIKKNQLLEKINIIKKKNIPIVGIGASAKGNTFLNYHELNHIIIDYVTDISDHKLGKFTPKTRIPIVKDSVFSKYDEVYALLLTENISNNFKNTLLKINDKIQFLYET